MTPPKNATFFVLAICAGQLAGCQRPPITAAQVAAEASKRATLPLDLGDGFRLDAITAEGNTIVSIVTLTDASLAPDPAFQQIIRTATVSDICREIAPAMQSYVDADLTIAKIYRAPNGAELLRVDVRPADCG